MESKTTLDEKRFTNQNWKVVLNEIYNYAPNGYGRGNPQYQDDHPLARRSKIKGYELNLIMAFLDDNGRIEYVKPENNWIRLSVFNKVTAFLSLAIAIFAVLQLITGITDLARSYVISILILVALIVGGFVIIKSRL